MAVSAKWYILQTTPMYENSVARRLRAMQENGVSQIHDVKVITETVTKQCRNRKGEPDLREVDEKVFPCYVFIKMEFEQSLVSMLRRLEGVLRWVGIGYNPDPLSDEEIAKIPGLSEQVHHVIGEKYKVSSGPFEGFIGILQQIENTKGKILMNVFGRDIAVDAPLAALQPVLLQDTD